MVSQSTGQRESLLHPWEGEISDDSGHSDGLPRPLHPGHGTCQSDFRFTRHRAAWVNPYCAQQPLQDLPEQVPMASNRESHFERDIASPLDPPLLSYGNCVVETSLCKDSADSTGSSSDPDSGAKSGHFSLTSTEEQVVLPRCSSKTSLFTSSKMLATSPCPKTFSDLSFPSHWTLSTNEDAVQDSKRTISLNSFSPKTFALPVDVEKENAHFYAADMIIAAMEKIKYNFLSQQHTENWSLKEASGLPGNDQTDSEVICPTNAKQESGSSASSDSGYEGCAVLQLSPLVEMPTPDVVKEACNSDFEKFVILELGEFTDTTEMCGSSCSPSKKYLPFMSTSVTYKPDFNSAETIAKELYQVFRKCWMLSEINDQHADFPSGASSVVVNKERVQKDFVSSVDVVQEIKFKSRIRGTEDWAPPRFQLIFNVHPAIKRDLVIAAQNSFCAGCGTPIEPKFVKRLRYCEYLGKYFCDCCHSYAESCIPARILVMWDFKKYYISNFSKRLLDSIWHQPIFNLLNRSHNLYAKAKELDRVRETQEQLFHVKKLLKTCRFAESALKEFEQVPRHLTDELHLFSLDDLVRVKKGLLAPLLKDTLKTSLTHVSSCELCQGKGFICEFCQSAAVIFPFQTATCRRCSACRACFHKECFQSSQCPRCARLMARRRVVEGLPSAAT
ncbi:protein associated with UVRAG as autophagy enhancer isoform X2 [Erinaceus europaeus]|uniref:Protein associated with UVRAG as autophagy enhancer isoform X2 n=1 Tax=Erinaceus europaeus TaxID=9365 RepID=A0ABM3XPS7_ERIEU|nr:protein associated with UVRAG as autophagy enhancer isoform X2 [Erinaceus europaeus]